MTSLDRNPFHRSSPPMPLSARAVPRRFSPRLTSAVPLESENQVPLIQSWIDRAKKTAWDRVTGWVRRRADELVHRSIDQFLPESSHQLHGSVSSILSLPPPTEDDARPPAQDPRGGKRRRILTPPLATTTPRVSNLSEPPGDVCGVECPTPSLSSLGPVTAQEVREPRGSRVPRIRTRTSTPALYTSIAAT